MGAGEACPELGLYVAHPAGPSEEQGLLLEVIPLPQRQALKLLGIHAKHLLELLRRQVSLQREGGRGSAAHQAPEPGVSLWVQQ